MAGRPTRRGGQISSTYRLATNRQIWTLNAAGLLTLSYTEDAFAPGADPENEPIRSEEAKLLIGRLIEERWAGLGRCPRAGESWTVRNGLVELVRP